jgi:hypothetical protein
VREPKQCSWIAAAALLLLGCATEGSGSGKVVRGPADGQGVKFTWLGYSAMQPGPQEGEISATLDGGRSYRGKFYQISGTTSADSLSPLWQGYEPWWVDWGGEGYSYTGPDYVKHYSGRVLAVLTDGKEDRMRCRFVLTDGAAGMAGGGRGQCRLRSGSVIAAHFPKQ